ncbi:MAG: DUF3105 domain-containing protein [Gaiellaceae bacterium]
MAKKVQAPAPPRKVQAPNVRQKQDVGGGGFAMPSTNVLIGVGLAGVVALVVALVVMLSGGGSGGGEVTAADVARVRAAVTAAGGTLVSRSAGGAQKHMSDPNQRVRYQTFPASSGIHNPTTSIWGNYRLPVDPRQAVHNLEHGGVAIWYGPDISAANRAALDAFYEEDENGIIITPVPDPYPGVTYPKHEALGSRIALTVWTVPEGGASNGTVYIATLPKFDEKAFAAFRDTFRGKGPERFPVSQMVPGGN